MNDFFMKMALVEAGNSGNDLPIGAVIVKGDKVLSICHNQKEAQNNPSLHAEICAIKEACKKLDNWRLDGCDLYVTLEPCPMCAWAILEARIENVYFGAYDNLYGALGSKIDLRKLTSRPLNVKGGMLESECKKLLDEYFEKVRVKK